MASELLATYLLARSHAHHNAALKLLVEGAYVMACALLEAESIATPGELDAKGRARVLRQLSRLGKKKPLSDDAAFGIFFIGRINEYLLYGSSSFAEGELRGIGRHVVEFVEHAGSRIEDLMPGVCDEVVLERIHLIAGAEPKPRYQVERMQRYACMGLLEVPAALEQGMYTAAISILRHSALDVAHALFVSHGRRIPTGLERQPALLEGLIESSARLNLPKGAAVRFKERVDAEREQRFAASRVEPSGEEAFAEARELCGLMEAMVDAMPPRPAVARHAGRKAS